MKKRIISWFMICIIMIMTITPLNLQAAQKEPITPMWTNILSLEAFITFNGRNGTFDIIVYGHSGVTNITADVTLYWKNSSGVWQDTTRDWSYSADQMTLTAEGSFTGVAGREYKIVVDGTVTKNGYSESFSKSATAVCPGA